MEDGDRSAAAAVLGADLLPFFPPPPDFPLGRKGAQSQPSPRLEKWPWLKFGPLGAWRTERDGPNRHWIKYRGSALTPSGRGAGAGLAAGGHNGVWVSYLVPLRVESCYAGPRLGGHWMRAWSAAHRVFNEREGLRHFTFALRKGWTNNRASEKSWWFIKRIGIIAPFFSNPPPSRPDRGGKHSSSRLAKVAPRSAPPRPVVSCMARAACCH